MRSLLASVVFCLAMSLAGLPAAHAEDANEIKARGLFQSAMESYAKGDYDATIEKLSAAYSFFPSPGFLYNLGLTWEKKGSMSRAASFYRSFLEASGESNPKLMAKIESMEARVARETAKSSAWIAPREKEAPATAPVRSHVVMGTRDWTAVSRKVGGGKYGAWPWVTVATTGAGLVTGIVFASLSRVNYNDANDLSKVANPTPDQVGRLSSLKSTTRTQSIVADVSFGVAAAAGVASLVLFLTEYDGVGTEGGVAMEVVPTFGGGEGGFAVTGRF